MVNRTGPTTTADKAPCELFHKSKPDLRNFQVFGIIVFVHVPKQKRVKWDPKGMEGIFIEYGQDVKGFRVYFPNNKIVPH